MKEQEHVALLLPESGRVRSVASGKEVVMSKEAIATTKNYGASQVVVLIAMTAYFSKTLNSRTCYLYTMIHFVRNGAE